MKDEHMTDTETLPPPADAAEGRTAIALTDTTQDGYVAQASPLDAANMIVNAPRDLLPAPIRKLKEMAWLISTSLNAPVAFQGHPEKCLSIAYQAALWKMDGMAVASKCYLVPVKGGGERLAYEAQLVHALILSRVKFAPDGAPRTTYVGEGQQRYAIVTATLEGETVPRIKTSPIIGQITPKHSPLWVTDPDQQLYYWTTRAWARKEKPDVILGVYTPDEMPRIESMQDVTPRRSPYAPQISQTADGAENPASAAGGEISGSGVDVSAEPPPPSGGRGVVNKDDKAKTTKAGGVKAADIGPNPWPDVEDIMEWLEAFKAEVDAQAARTDLAKLFETARAHGLIGRLKKASATDHADLIKTLDAKNAELKAAETPD
jgi:hypothetical protein